ncbi:MAG: anion permease, partial [Bdellovibrionales bacterium]|nr:anion permease [Bdellovibrionales bacterium]
LICGVIYLFVLSRSILHKDVDNADQNLGIKYDLRSYTSELSIEAGSSICNQTLADSPLSREMHLNVLGVLRGEDPVLVPRSTLLLQEGDRLVVEGNLQDLNDALQKYKLKFEDEREVDPGPSDEATTKKKKRNFDLALHEVLVSPRSLLVGRTPREAYLRNRRRLSLIAINRQGVTLRNDLSDVRIIPGDILVVQFLETIDNQTLDNLGLIPLQEHTQQRFRTDLAPLAAFIFIFSLLIGSVSQYPIALFTLAGAVAMVIFGVLERDEMYRTIEWRVLIFIGAILCLGKGMGSSGTAALLGETLASLFEQLGPQYIIAFFFILTFFLTQLLSNQATAVVMIPVAVQTASTLHFEPMGMIMAVAIASSCAFMTPFEPALMLVYGAGSYRFFDFIKLGFFLGLIALTLALMIIPTIWAL